MVQSGSRARLLTVKTLLSYIMIAGAIILHASMPLAYGTTTTASSDTCGDEFIACLADIECSACFSAEDDSFCTPPSTQYETEDPDCDDINDYFCCMVEYDGNCANNEFLLNFFGELCIIG